MEQLGDLGTGNQAHVQKAIVGYGTGGLAVAMGRTYAKGHAFSDDVFTACSEIVLEVHAPEKHQKSAEKVRQGAQAQEMFGLSVNVNDGSDGTDIDAVEKIA